MSRVWVTTTTWPKRALRANKTARHTVKTRMSPISHLLVSWVIADKTTTNARDRKLVTLAGVIPDLDGLGLVGDGVAALFGLRSPGLYEHYHHYLLHGLAGAVGVSILLTLFARNRGRVALLTLLTFHLHLLCDFVGSRGPSRDDLWAIFYYGPFNRDPMWIWKGQWALDGWQNKVIFILLFAWCLRIAVQEGRSVVELFSGKANAGLVKVLRKWQASPRRSPIAEPTV